jgi:hypothetical protein
MYGVFSLAVWGALYRQVCGGFAPPRVLAAWQKKAGRLRVFLFVTLGFFFIPCFRNNNKLTRHGRVL